MSQFAENDSLAPAFHRCHLMHDTRIGNHPFRATGITEYPRNGGRREIAQQMANHESARTTGFYDRRDDEVTLDEIERIVI
jgi:cytochrome c biogenesis protein ResB